MEILSFGRPPPVKVGACRALSQLLPECNHETIQPHIMGLLLSLTELLRQVVILSKNFKISYLSLKVDIISI